ncbi:MAG TPA: hypothetical protein VD866_21035, partial [Urbifossiella sp.]|nr:hypothetical protein [Urbifossiella sp.]
HFADFGVAPVQDRALRDLLTTAVGAGAKPALLLMPESPWFRGLYPPGGRDAVRAYVAALGREHGAAVFDASDWVSDEDAFTDGHHLLGPAAEAFSRRLGRDALGPWLGVPPRGGD